MTISSVVSKSWKNFVMTSEEKVEVMDDTDLGFSGEEVKTQTIWELGYWMTNIYTLLHTGHLSFIVYLRSLCHVITQRRLVLGSSPSLKEGDVLKESPILWKNVLIYSQYFFRLSKYLVVCYP